MQKLFDQIRGAIQVQLRKARRRRRRRGLPPRKQLDLPKLPEWSAEQKSAILRTAMLVVCSAVFVFSLSKLMDYFHDYLQKKQAAAELRAVYYEEEEPDQQEEDWIQPTPQPRLITPEPAQNLAAEYKPEVQKTQIVNTPAPSPTPQSVLKKIYYPNNPDAVVSSRFEKIRRQNKDIVGWLTIDGLLDEAVVHRDNDYYLRRDYRGYHNENGSLFLEETCSLKTRPYTLMIYGHNMKSGLMFGCLRNYERLSFYRQNPFITFDTAYEKGKYVIFSIANMMFADGYQDTAMLAQINSSSIEQRQKAIDLIESRAKFVSKVDVQPDDQIMMLITCLGDGDARRILFARRVRDGEDEEMLRHQVDKAKVR